MFNPVKREGAVEMIKEINFQSDGVRIRLCGIITSKDVLDANTKLIEHPNFTSFMYQLWHLDPIEDIILSAKEIQMIADQDIIASEMNSELKLCVVSSSPLSFSLGSIWDVFYGGGPWKIKYYYTVEEAEVWIAG